MNRYYPHTIIAQEGWAFIIGGVVVSVIIMLLGGWWSLPFWLATLFMLNFFRDPARNIPEAPDAILSPADGRVVVVEKAIDPYRNIESLKISVFMNVFDVHSQRAPARGKITDVRYTAGKKLNASLDKASSENERNAVLMTTASGREITFVQIAGLVARRILCYVNKGDSLVRGERYGFIRFGSRVDVYLPLDANPNVAIGDKVRATETILAFLPLQQDPNFDPRQVQIQSKSNQVSPAARLKADKVEQNQRNNQIADDLDAQIRERIAAQFQKENQSHAHSVHSGSIAKEESEVAARLAKIQAERQAESAERERILAEEAAEAEAVRQRIAKEQAEEAAKIAAAQRAKAAAEQAAKAQAEKIAAEQAAAEERAKIQAAQAAEQARIQAALQAKAHAEHLAEQARLQAEQAAKAEAERIRQEQARLQAEQIAKAEAERIRQEQARLQAEQAAKAEAERIRQEQERLRAEEEAERARILAEAEAEEEAVRQRLAMEAEIEAAAQRAQQEAEKFRKQKNENESKEQHDESFRKAEEQALAEIAARKPIVRRESFATVPEPWQTIEPSEIVIKVDEK